VVARHPVDFGIMIASEVEKFMRFPEIMDVTAYKSGMVELRYEIRK
jgi:hypothetical protein